MQSEELINALIEQTGKNIEQIEKLKNNDLTVLRWKKNPNSWSILECLEHLNLYGDFYLPEIEIKIKNANTTNEIVFKPGILGNYFAKTMLPKHKLNKMKTFQDKNPLNANLDKTVIDVCINQQIQLLELLNQSKNISLNRLRIKISISKFIKLKLGDTFRFLINHIIRHLQQIERIKAERQTA